ncbi:general stress protein [Calothrix sp. CCY 0018]|uniref:general stress protein n=1 Tax=Calothrix sp. CCY 0018 TaxID=3103864 RepID=UPI0039C6F79B
MALGENRRAVGTFSSRNDLEYALRELRDDGFDMNKVSVIARNSDTGNQVAGVETTDDVGNKADEGAAAGALTGGVFGGITGLMVGLSSLVIPGVGPILLAGEIATALITTVAGAGIGAASGGLLGALAGLGIPEERAHIYNSRIERGDYLLIFDGTEASINRAELIVKNRSIEEFEIYNAPNPVLNSSDNVNTKALSEALPKVMGDTDPQVVIIDSRESAF